jgi:hypothetical protein
MQNLIGRGSRETKLNRRKIFLGAQKVYFVKCTNILNAKKNPQPDIFGYVLSG